MLRAQEMALDRAVLTLFEGSPVPSNVASVFETLRQCLELARSGKLSDGDKAELPRLEKLADLLQELAAPRPAPEPPPRPASPAPGSVPMPAKRSTAPSSERAPKAPAPPAVASPAAPSSKVAGIRVTLPFGSPPRTDEIVTAVLSKLASLYLWRASLLADVLSSWRDFRHMDGQLQDAIWSATWLDAAILPAARELLVVAEDEAGRFAAGLALLVTNRADVLEAFLAAPAGAASFESEGIWCALRLGADLAVWQRLGEALPGLRKMNAHHLSALADVGQLAADTLLELLHDTSDELAIRAAELLAWLGRPPADARIVEGLLAQGVSESRLGPFLYCAVALGSATALEQVRRRLDAEESMSAYAIDALAVAGGAHDSERLLRLAARDEALAPLALLAAGHLGNRAVVSAVSAGAEPAAAAQRARRTIVGDAAEEMAGPTGERLLYGKAWALPGVLARLGAADELLRARRWLALEMTVRTGAQPSAVLDISARIAVQDAAITHIRTAIENWRRPIPAGAWLYFGKAIV